MVSRNALAIRNCFITAELLLIFFVLWEGYVFAYLLVIGILFMIIQEPRPDLDT